MDIYYKNDISIVTEYMAHVLIAGEQKYGIAINRQCKTDILIDHECKNYC